MMCMRKISAHCGQLGWQCLSRLRSHHIWLALAAMMRSGTDGLACMQLCRGLISLEARDMKSAHAMEICMRHDNRHAGMHGQKLLCVRNMPILPKVKVAPESPTGEVSEEHSTVPC
jgi:hypothetical protein